MEEEFRSRWLPDNPEEWAGTGELERDRLVAELDLLEPDEPDEPDPEPEPVSEFEPES